MNNNNKLKSITQLVKDYGLKAEYDEKGNSKA